MSVEDKLQSMGYQLPPVVTPVAAYIPGVVVGDLIYTSGQIPIKDGQVVYAGRLGEDLSVAEGYAAAQLCTLNGLAVVKHLAGSLNKIRRIVKVTGYVNSADSFTEQPQVVNGASELLGELLGESGRHARSAVGVNTLPLGSAVELEFIVQLHPN